MQDHGGSLAARPPAALIPRASRRNLVIDLFIAFILRRARQAPRPGRIGGHSRSRPTIDMAVAQDQII